MFDENTSVRLSAISMSARRLNTTGPSGPGRNTGLDSRNILYIGWGSTSPVTAQSTTFGICHSDSVHQRLITRPTLYHIA